MVGVRTENYAIACTTSESRMHNKCINFEIQDVRISTYSIMIQEDMIQDEERAQ